MFGSMRWHHQYTSLFLTLLPIHLSRNFFSSDALLFSSARRSCNCPHTTGSLLLQRNGFQYPSIRHRFRSNLASNDDTLSDLTESIRESYELKETDGILELATSLSIMVDSSLDVEADLVPSILDASGGTKGTAASIMNALIGSGCLFTKSEIEGGKMNVMSTRILLLMEILEEAGGIEPDIVTQSLAYRALSMDPDYSDLAFGILEQAERKSKKLAGGKRRKLLASARRQKVSTFVEAEENLKGILGDDFSVLMETDDFAVVNKPSGIPCFHKKKTTAGKIKRGKGKKKKGKSNGNADSLESSSDVSLEDALVSCNVVLSTLNPEALGLVHRLDRGSSGCIVFAKSNDMHAKLVSEFFLRRTTKKYVALLRESSESSIPEAGSGLIDHPVSRRPARSQYSLLERYKSSSDEECEDNAALVEFEIFTGRKHQIRVHAAEVLGSPVWGDPLYGSSDDRSNGAKPSNDISKRILLHAHRLTIPQLDIEVESPIPTWWDSTISTFESK